MTTLVNELLTIAALGEQLAFEETPPEKVNLLADACVDVIQVFCKHDLSAYDSYKVMTAICAQAAEHTGTSTRAIIGAIATAVGLGVTIRDDEGTLVGEARAHEAPEIGPEAD